MRFNHLTIEDGLSQSTINDILQDSRGFLWFATEDGLNRYDGYEFTVYKNAPGDSTSISGNSISAIIEDVDGDIWVATQGEGLNRFDRKTERFERFQHDPEDPESLNDNYVTTLFEDRSGVILVGTQKGLNILNPEKETFIRYEHEEDDNNSLNGTVITSIIEDHRGLLWIGTQNNGLNRFNRETENFTHFRNEPGNRRSLSDDWVVNIYEDRGNRLWVGTQDGGLNLFNRQTQDFKRYRHEPNNPSSLSHNWVLTMFEDIYGSFWVGTMNGLNLFDEENDSFSNISRINDAPNLSNKSISALYEDRSGVFWVGTRDDALHKFVRSTEYFTIYDRTPGAKLSLTDDNVWAISEVEDGSLWIGTQGGGVNRISPDRESITYFQHDPNVPNSLSSDFVSAIYEDSDGEIWVGTYEGLNLYMPSEGGFRHYRNDPQNPSTIGGNVITTISEDKTGKIWVGTLNNGLAQYDKTTRRFTNYRSEADNTESLSHNKIWSFYEDRSGVFWVGTHGFGLNKYDRTNDVFNHYVHDPADEFSLSNNFINFIYQDEEFRYWVGTLNGLNRFFPETETFKKYTVKDGLPNNVVYGVIEDERGHLWLSTNKGLSDFDPDEETFRNYDVGDGLPSDEFRFGAYHRGKSGTMYFGGISGVVAFESDSIRDNPNVPPVVLTNFEIYNQTVPIKDGGVLANSITETESIKLTYKEQVFSFEFAALHYAAPTQNQYAYMLEGFDEEWQYINDRRFISFTSLPADNYTLRVKAANKDGVWNEEGTSLSITVTPPPWFTWWAYTIYSCVGLGLVFGFIQYRISKERAKKKQLEKHNVELEQEVASRTMELQKEKDKSERLLYNILPRELADELKEEGVTQPRRYEVASVMFTDFKEFSSISSSMSATNLVRELNEIFQNFDRIVEDNGLEKIKTIGDGYMAAGGVPTEDELHAVRCVNAAMEMQEYISKRNSESSFKWEMRVGIHTGSIIAGVVGQRKFTYDLWGDTVIMASRMEAESLPGEVNISASTHNLVKDYFKCEYRGKIDTVGKGSLDMYFIKEKVKEYRAESRKGKGVTHE